MGEASDEARPGRQFQRSQWCIERLSGRRRVVSGCERGMYELQRPAGWPGRDDRLGQQDQWAHVLHPPERPMVHVAKTQVNAEAGPLGRGCRYPSQPLTEHAGKRRMDGSRELGEQDEFGRDLELAHLLERR